MTENYVRTGRIKSVIKRGHRKSQKPYLKHSICHVQIYYSYFFVLINPVTRLDIIQPGEWWGPKTLLPECCCLQGTTGCCTNVQYWSGPSLHVCYTLSRDFNITWDYKKSIFCLSLQHLVCFCIFEQRE